MGDVVPLPVVGVDVPNHVTDALGRLLEQDKNKTNVTALLTALVTSVQDLESALWQLLTQRRATTAIGSQLDAIGKLVNQARLGFDDTNYARLISARIVANVSRGRYEDLIAISKIVVNDASTVERIVNVGVATLIDRIQGNRVEWSTAAILISMLRDASSCRAVLEFLTYATVTVTKNESTTGWTARTRSTNTIAGDGYVEATVDAVTALYRTISLTVSTDVIGADISENTTDYGFGYGLASGQGRIIERGSIRMTGIVLAVGDKIRIERVGSVVYYKLNGTTIYTSLIVSLGSLLVDVSHFDIGTVVQNLKLFSAGKRQLLSFAPARNVVVTPYTVPPTYAERLRAADSQVYAFAAYPTTAGQMATALGYGTWTGGAGYLLDEQSGNAASVFGAPATLTASGTLFYECPGFRGGADKAIGFATAGNNYLDGGSAFDISSTDDLAVVFVGYLTGAPTANATTLSKTTTAFGNGWAVGSSTSSNLGMLAGASVSFTALISTTNIMNQWFAAIGVIDRSTGKIRFGVQLLQSGVQTISAESAISGSLSNAGTFRVGASGWTFLADPAIRISAAYVVSGSGVATGLSANLATALTNFSNYVNRTAYGTRTNADYGNGAEDQNDKYPRVAASVATIAGFPSLNAGVGYLCNEASGNISAAYGSTPASMTASGAGITYGKTGPRAGRDTAISITGNSGFDGGANNDVTTTDLFVWWIGRFRSATVTDSDTVLSKVSATFADGWSLSSSGTNSFVLAARPTGGSFVAASISNLLPGEWHALLGVIDRTSNKLVLGIQGLTTGTQVIGAAATPGAVNFTTAANFKFGTSAWTFNAEGTFDMAAFCVATGSNVAAGIGNNMSATLAKLAAQANRYYGGPVHAAME